MYEHIDPWNETVIKADPDGMFWSDWLQAQFGLAQRDLPKVKAKDKQQ